MADPVPSLSEVHADLVGRLKHDERIRALEQSQARVEVVISEMPRMEARIMAAITDVLSRVAEVRTESKPRSPWPAVSAIAACVAVFFVAAAAIYTR